MRWGFASTLLVSALGLSACAKAPAALKVKGPRDALESVNMDPKFPPFEKKGDTIQLRASAFDDKGAYMGPVAVKWDSSDKTVATVDAKGLVTILSSGQVNILATATEVPKPLEASLSLEARIVDKVRIVSGDPKPRVIHLGETLPWRAEVLDDRGNVIPGAKTRWQSSSFAVSVTDSGEVEGRAIGSATVTVESGPARDRVELEVVDWEKKRRG